MKDTTITIQGIAVQVLVDNFNVYQLYETFTTSPEAEVGTDFILWLVATQQVSMVETGTVVVEPDTAYLLWGIVPTAAEMQAIQDLLATNPQSDLKPHHLEILATGHRLGTHLDRPFEEHLDWLTRDLPLIALVVEILSAHQAVQQQEPAQQDTWAIESRSGEDGSPVKQYSYTMYLTLSLGYELLIVNAAEDGPLILETVAQLLTRATDPLHIGEVVSLDELTVDGRPIRARVVNLDLDEVVPEITLAMPDGLDVNDIKQVLISDANGILPGEDGYDTSFVQDLTQG